MKTAECVTPGHPDKMCDRISDAILDAYLKQDPNSRVAVETMGGHGKVYLTGEVTSNGLVTVYELNDIVNRIARKGTELFDVNISLQSPEIAQGVDTGGAGDQGIMIGFACDENEEMIPQEYYLARRLCKFLFEKYQYDGKTQITLNNNSEIETIVASFQNSKKSELENAINEWLYINQEYLVGDKLIKIHANPAGDWTQGGFDADAGVTGRKLVVDNYGPQVTLGGGAFSGKDATKVDRSGAYIARYIAVKELRDLGAKEVTVKVAYSIGVAEPVMVTADVVLGNDEKSYKTKIDVTEKYNLRPGAISELLDLKKPMFEETAEWGHFGNGFNWDK